MIARVFKEIGWAEELGSGIRNIKKYSQIYSGTKPVFIEGEVFKTIIEIKEVDNVHSNTKNVPISADKLSINADKLPISADKLPISADKLSISADKYR